MIFQIAIKLRRHRAQLRQIVPWNRRKIVMLVVIAHVQCHPINRSVITERFLVEIVRVMLLNPARADRMQPNGKQKREHQIKKSGPTAEIDDRYVVRDRTPDIQREPTVTHLNCLEPRRTSDLKKWKQHQPD